MSTQVSVALCTYNGARFVAEQVLSILGQTQAVDEIVVSDDGSTDDTLLIVEATVSHWRAEHPGRLLGLRVLRNVTPLGVTANFEQALAACAGDLLALSDQDDLWHPQRIELMVAEFARRPELLLLNTEARLVDENGRPLGQNLLDTLGVSDVDREAVHAGRAIDTLLRRNIVTGATTMLRRELFERARPFPASWVHDEWLAIVAAATGEMDFLDEPLLDYRQHSANQIGASSLGAAGKIGRLKAPRAARNARLLARATVFQERAGGLMPQPSAETLAKVEAKHAHELMRSGLPASRIRRISPVARAWRLGAYNRFGLGLQDVLRDLVQPT
ncbi:glycosyltransferase family 2 protein [Leifsonia sp. YAF41]|uniref:glycosyltransferase family 2 protein n=1 Tax=Leifsonia sp. YAF41 TaxID=3233086 RepID=UPI003F9956A3